MSVVLTKFRSKLTHQDMVLKLMIRSNGNANTRIKQVVGVLAVKPCRTTSFVYIF